MRNALGLLIAVLVSTACHDSTNPSDSLSEAIQALRIPPDPPAPPPDPITLETGRDAGFFGRDRCENTLYRESATPSQLASFAPNSDALAPGLVVKGESIDGGVLSPLGLPLSNQTLVVTDIGLPDSSMGGVQFTVRVTQPTIARTTQAIQDLLQGLAGITTPARVSHSATSYYSLEHAALKLGASAEYLTATARLALERSEYLQQSHVVAALTQAYYNVSVVPPPSGEGEKIFARGVDGDDLRKALNGSDLMPAYVSTVTYGRLILVSVSAQAKSDSLRLAVDAAVGFATGSASANLTVAQQQILQASEFRLLAIGGAGNDAVRIIQGLPALDSMRAAYRAGANWGPHSPGLPISYQLRWLNTNDQARLTFTTDYEVRTCRPQRITAFGFRFQTEDDNKDGGDLVSADIYAGSRLVANDPEVGLAGHEWDQHTRQPDPGDASWGGIAGWFTIPLLVQDGPTIDQCRSLTLRISKGGGRGWRFSPYFMAVIEDGSVISLPIPSLFNGQTPWQLGNGQVNSRDFGTQGC